MTESEGWSFNPTDIRKGFYRFSNMGVAGVMKEVKLWCSKCHFRFFTTVANDEPGHLPTTFDITPFSFTPTMTARLHKRDWVPFAISTSPVIHNTPCLPHTPHPPPPPKAFSIRIVFNFSWEDYNTQEKLKTKVMQNLRDKQGVLHKRCANGKCCFRKAESIFTLLLYKTPHSYSW